MVSVCFLENNWFQKRTHIGPNFHISIRALGRSVFSLPEEKPDRFDKVLVRCLFKDYDDFKPRISAIFDM